MMDFFDYASGMQADHLSLLIRTCLVLVALIWGVFVLYGLMQHMAEQGTMSFYQVFKLIMLTLIFMVLAIVVAFENGEVM